MLKYICHFQCSVDTVNMLKKWKKNIIAYQGATYIWCLAVDGTRTGCLATVDWMDNYIPTENNKCDYLDLFGT